MVQLTTLLLQVLVNSEVVFCVISFFLYLYWPSFAVAVVVLMRLCFKWRCGFMNCFTYSTSSVDPVKVVPREVLIGARQPDHEIPEKENNEPDDSVYASEVHLSRTPTVSTSYSELDCNPTSSSQEDNSEPDNDAVYVSEDHLQEAPIASVIDSKWERNPSCSLQEYDDLYKNKPKFKTAIESSPKTLCKICLEEKDHFEMFNNEPCSHSFCYDCTITYVVSKIHDRVASISCPGPQCPAFLDTGICRLLIPDDILVQWDELICLSLIPESQKFFCPYIDCSALLVNDSESDELLKQIKCAVCKRHFCVKCCVPWHWELTCEEIEEQSGKGDDEKVKELAEKKKWRMCPTCKVYIEKYTGCSHMVCRCLHQMCYRCGKDWLACRGYCPPLNLETSM